MDFEKTVVKASQTKPVLVDFWAPWCGPCRVLTPVLESLAEENAGRWSLVKVNTEDQPDIAMKYNVMSIPNVKLFFRGKVIAEFVGALPKPAVEKWLADHLPSTSKIALQEILDRSDTWPDPALINALEKFLKDDPENREAKLHLARHTVINNPDKALNLVQEVPAVEGALEIVDDIKSLASLLQFEKNGNPEMDAILAAAKESLSDAEMESAAQNLIDATMRDKKYASGLPRKAGVALFRMLGEGHPVTRQKRKVFNMALY